MGIFNAREVAIIIWLVLFVCYIFYKKETRSSALQVLRAAASIKLIIPVVIAGCIVASVIYLLSLVDLWEITELKDTLIWFFFAGIALLYRGVSSPDPDTAIREATNDSIKVVLIAEFILNAYTFPFWVELILTPFLVLLALSQAIADSRPSISSVSKLLKAIQTLFGFSIIGLTIWGLYTDYGQVFSLLSLKAFLLPIILSLIFIPLAYFMGLIAAYENLFIPLKVGMKKPFRLRIAARFRLILMLGFSLRDVCEARKKLKFELGLLQSTQDLNRALKILR